VWGPRERVGGAGEELGEETQGVRREKSKLLFQERHLGSARKGIAYYKQETCCRIGEEDDKYQTQEKVPTLLPKK